MVNANSRSCRLEIGLGLLSGHISKTHITIPWRPRVIKRGEANRGWSCVQECGWNSLLIFPMFWIPSETSQRIVVWKIRSSYLHNKRGSSFRLNFFRVVLRFCFFSNVSFQIFYCFWPFFFLSSLPLQVYTAGLWCAHFVQRQDTVLCTPVLGWMKNSYPIKK